MGLFSHALSGVAGLASKAPGGGGFSGAVGGVGGLLGSAASRMASPTVAPSTPNTSGGLSFSGPFGKLASGLLNSASQRGLIGTPPPGS